MTSLSVDNIISSHLNQSVFLPSVPSNIEKSALRTFLYDFGVVLQIRYKQNEEYGSAYSAIVVFKDDVASKKAQMSSIPFMEQKIEIQPLNSVPNARNILNDHSKLDEEVERRQEKFRAAQITSNQGLSSNETLNEQNIYQQRQYKVNNRGYTQDGQQKLTRNRNQMYQTQNQFQFNSPAQFPFYPSQFQENQYYLENYPNNYNFPLQFPPDQNYANLPYQFQMPYPQLQLFQRTFQPSFESHQRGHSGRESIDDESLKNVDPFRLSVLNRTAYIGNLPPNCKEEDVVRLAMTCGPISQARLCGNNQGDHRFAFVEFMSDESYHNAFQYLDKKSFFGKKISLNTSNRPIIKDAVHFTKDEEQIFTTAVLNLKYKLLQYCDDHDIEVGEEDRDQYIKEKKELEEALSGDSTEDNEPITTSKVYPNTVQPNTIQPKQTIPQRRFIKHQNNTNNQINQGYQNQHGQPGQSKQQGYQKLTQSSYQQQNFPQNRPYKRQFHPNSIQQNNFQQFPPFVQQSDVSEIYQGNAPIYNKQNQYRGSRQNAQYQDGYSTQDPVAIQNSIYTQQASTQSHHPSYSIPQSQSAKQFQLRPSPYDQIAEEIYNSEYVPPYLQDTTQHEIGQHYSGRKRHHQESYHGPTPGGQFKRKRYNTKQT